MSGVFTSAFSQNSEGLWAGYRYGYVGSGSSYSSGSSYTRTMNSNTLATQINRNYAADIKNYNLALEDNNIAEAMEILEKLRKEANSIATDRNSTVDDGTIETALARCGVSKADACENANGSFVTGLLNGIPLVGTLFSSYSKGEIKSAFEGKKTKTKDVVGESLGKIISGGATGAIVGLFTLGPIAGAAIGIGIAFGQNFLKEKLVEA